MTAYQKLKDELTIIDNINKGASVLGWDQQVMMPKYAAEERSQILATLGKIAHERFTSSQLKEWIDASQSEVSDAWDVKNLKMIKDDYTLATCLSGDFVYKLNEARSMCQQVWEEEKPTSDWQKVLPHLRKLVALAKEEAALYAELLGCSPYDALLRLYAPGNSQALIDPLFASLKEKLPPLVKQIMAKQDVKDTAFNVTIDVQEQIGRDIAQKIGFSFERGRLDKSAHPFSGGTNNDSRITTRYKENEPFSSLFGVMHEVGHALYSQNLPIAWQGLPIGGDRDLSLHESQSLSVEIQAGFSDGFLRHMYDIFAQHDSVFAAQASFDVFKAHIRKVEPSFIRVDADEATYPLHVILRYEIEKEIFNNDLDIGLLPDVWNAKFKEFFGIDVPAHNLGCMQDVHWFSGSFGYFPTYTQGALYAAQLCTAMRRDIPDLDAQLSKGDFSGFIGWQTKNVHQWGQFYDAADLIEKATGAKPSAQYFLDHLTKRYLG